MKAKALKSFINIIIILLGNALYALGVALFIVPDNLITGGTTGIALFINYCTGLPVSYFVLFFNILMLITGYMVLGKKFAMTTIISTFSYPIFLEIIQKLLNGYVITTNMMLATIYAGLCIGCSIGIVIRFGASTGGMDIPPLVLYKKFKIPVSVSMYVFDFIILLLQFFGASAENILYGILLVIIYTIVIDKILLIGNRMFQIKVISEKSEEIKCAIISEIDRGVTLLHGQSGYLSAKTDVVLSIVNPRELPKIEKLIRDIDSHAFLVVSSVNEVYGRGFSIEKKYM